MTRSAEIWLKWWTEDGGRHTSKYISVYVVLAVGAWGFRMGTLWSLLVRISPMSSAKLHHTLLRTTIEAPQSFYAETDTGLTLNRFSQDIGLVDRVLPMASGRLLLRKPPKSGESSAQN
jgi:ATP-binding cassette, subfamily C (CFTR/MRP), member 1